MTYIISTQKKSSVIILSLWDSLWSLFYKLQKIEKLVSCSLFLAEKNNSPLDMLVCYFASKSLSKFRNRIWNKRYFLTPIFNNMLSFEDDEKCFIGKTTESLLETKNYPARVLDLARAPLRHFLNLAHTSYEHEQNHQIPEKKQTRFWLKHSCTFISAYCNPRFLCPDLKLGLLSELEKIITKIMVESSNFSICLQVMHNLKHRHLKSEWLSKVLKTNQNVSELVHSNSCKTKRSKKWKYFTALFLAFLSAFFSALILFSAIRCSMTASSSRVKGRNVGRLKKGHFAFS